MDFQIFETRVQYPCPQGISFCGLGNGYNYLILKLENRSPRAVEPITPEAGASIKTIQTAVVAA